MNIPIEFVYVILVICCCREIYIRHKHRGTTYTEGYSDAILNIVNKFDKDLNAGLSTYQRISSLRNYILDEIKDNNIEL